MSEVMYLQGVDLELAERWARRLDEQCGDGKRWQLRPMPGAFYSDVPQQELTVWCVLRGLYYLPTLEVVDWLRPHIEGKRAIEIGAGNGALGRALGIPRTDSYQQQQPEVAQFYKMMGQAPVQYGADVEKMTAEQALSEYRPEVVIGSWITHRFEASRPEIGGNAEGVDEEALIGCVDKYIMIGHESPHQLKPARKLQHDQYQHSALYSRSMDAAGNRIWVWQR